MTERKTDEPPSALLDTCALFQQLLRDTLLRAAEAGVFRPRWSADILDELARNLIGDRRLERARVDRLMQAMRYAFPGAEVTGYQAMVAQMRNHPRDRHVLAAAVVGGAEVVVTFDIRDFADPAIVPRQVRVQTPDQFLCRLFDSAPGAILQNIREQAAEYRRPPFSLEEVIGILARQAPEFAGRIRARLATQS